ncbi:MAG: ATP-binding protein [Bacteroidales bacterium]|nr:ATP-binding protein [Bacteroidales bacterium]
MERLYNTFRIKLSLTPMSYFRGFHEKINWKSRLICIMGQKGVGKSTLILQHIKKFDNLDETLYVSADNMYFAGHTLYDLAGVFFSQGGKRLYIDEIHKYNGWSTEIKNIYDDYPTLQVVYSGSSLLALKQGNKADLSRRSIPYEMPGLSFREFLNIRNGWNLKTSTLEEILLGKVDFPYGEHRPLKYYKEYCRNGFYPFFLEGDAEIRLQNAILATIEDDIPQYAEMTVAAASKLKKLMYILAKSVPFKPSNDTLGRDLALSRNSVPDYIAYLETSGLFNALREPGHSDNLLSRIEKIYLGNSNIAYSLSEDGRIDDGNMRETNFLAWTKQVCKPTSSKISDFEIDGITFEVGGKSKKGNQIKDAAAGYLVKDDLEYASGHSIPIWMFGFLY